MKRFTPPETIHPKLRGGRADVAGGLSVHALSDALACDVASFQLADHLADRLDRADPVAAARREAELLADFADFMIADLGDGGGAHTAPDPVFRERLRGRLWRMHALTTLRDRGQPH